MLPVYKAISFQSILEKGGRTKPWVVLVNTENSYEPYVVKLFDADFIENRDAVANEVLGNVLAKEFDLPVPQAALIDMDEDFVDSIRDFGVLDILDLKDDRLKFGTKLLNGFIQFDPLAFTTAEAKRMISIDTVLAFDNLIRNKDRNYGKPNLLVRSDEAYLIDHELGFEITEETITELFTKLWNSSFYQNHIFYNFLKNSWQRYKNEYFNEFEEYLRLLNVNVLKPYFAQLSNSGFSKKRHILITDYLSEMKNNSSKFADLLREILSS